MQIDFSKINFNDEGLVPAVVQDADSGAVIMLGYMTGEALMRTVETGYAWFWSRSHRRLWTRQGSDALQVVGVSYDTDSDTILLSVKQQGLAATGGFNDTLWSAGNMPVPEMDGIHGLLAELYRAIQESQATGRGKYLFLAGQDSILQQLGSTATATIIASKNDQRGAMVQDMANLWYYCLTLLAYHNISPTTLLDELGGRRK